MNPHTIGNIYQILGSHYILARSSAHPGHTASLVLINTVSGERWTNPIEIDIREGRDSDSLTDDEFVQMVGSRWLDTVVLVRPRQS